MCKCVIILGIFAVLGLAVLVLGFILGFVVFENIIEDGIISAVRLEQNTSQFDRFIEMPFPHKFKVYFYNVNNPAEVLTGAVPDVTEVGPYVYRQYRVRGNVTFNETTDKLTYTQNRNFVFDAEASGGRLENDTITVLNVPLQSLFQFGEAGPYIPVINTGWSPTFGETSIFHNIMVGQYLFDGFQFCNPLPQFPELPPVVQQLCGIIRTNLTSSRTMNVLTSHAVSFSFFDFMKNTNDGVFEIIAGMDEINDLGEIRTWNNQALLTTWGADNNTCNQIRGRGGVIFPPFNDDQSNFDIFNTDVCRIMNLEYDTTTEFQGIDGFRYTLRQDTLANATSPGQECFCINGIRNLEGNFTCLPNGFGDMSSCIGLPIVMSLPHLMWASPNYSNTVNGSFPNLNNHISFADIEPDTGTPLRTARRVQYNMFIRPIPGITVTNTITPSVLPILWFEEGMELSQGLVNLLNDEYFYAVVAFQAVTWVLVAAGAVVFLICLTCCIIRRCRK